MNKLLADLFAHVAKGIVATLPARGMRSDRSDEMSALATLAAAQRQDLASTAVLVSALAGVTVAYVAGALVAGAGALGDTIGWGLILVPLPVWLVAAFCGLAVVAMRHRMLVLRLVEREIILASPLGNRRALLDYWSRADDIMEHHRSAWLERLSVVILTVGVTSAIFGFTWWGVDGAQLDGPRESVALGLYGVIAFAVAAQMIRGDIALRRAVTAFGK